MTVLQELQDSVAKANNSNEEMIKIRKEIVDIHGEMVLLENYSALNYTGTNMLPLLEIKKYWNESHSIYSIETCLFIGLQELEIEIN